MTEISNDIRKGAERHFHMQLIDDIRFRVTESVRKRVWELAGFDYPNEVTRLESVQDGILWGVKEKYSQ